MAKSIAVLGAGMVGTCTALHLQQRGYEVTLIDRREPGLETSFGNAGIIQKEAVEPHPFPREFSVMLAAALGRGSDVRYHWNALPSVLPRLWQYFRNSATDRYPAISRAFSRLIEFSLSEHEQLIQASGADALLRREGFYFAYRTAAALEHAAADAQRLQASFGVRYRLLDSSALCTEEPWLKLPMSGAIHWQDPWTVTDPGGLVQRYASLFTERGGHITRQQITSISPSGNGWSLRANGQTTSTEQLVVALGPWAGQLIEPLGYRYPLFVKRGYHQHYRVAGGPRRPILDAERGYVLAPMARGLRLTTGAEFARLGAPPTPVQLQQCEVAARELLDLGQAVDDNIWLGNRPCTVDMLPVMGAATAHRGLWFNFGHAHQGFTLGPVAGRLLAELIAGERCWIDPAPYSPARFR